ncbi:hypothetical protein GCM10007382_19790 [Salinibacterium xinjiangense]|uniref:hypothetical protein n=1 Tax=Salinibacterium xinjiangense TaxID=386302 RepID=UPI0019AB024B|nr:hypothetical protein [Salinibacterium xinjiangense]GGK99919.1 hypothetical protein GCM10007382_19790 [Salinibacterium xinjiangense]
MIGRSDRVATQVELPLNDDRLAAQDHEVPPGFGVTRDADAGGVVDARYGNLGERSAVSVELSDGRGGYR